MTTYDGLTQLIAKVGACNANRTRIICSEECFNKLRKEATLDFPLPGHHSTGHVGEFKGVPIQIATGAGVRDDQIYVVAEQEYVHLRHDLRHDLSPTYSPYYTTYEVNLRDCFEKSESDRDDPVDIKDDDLMSVLNGGGFNATA